MTNDILYFGFSISPIDTLRTQDIGQLKQLEKISLPMTMEVIENDAFSNATNLRYVDMLMCDSTELISRIAVEGFSKLGYSDDDNRQHTGVTNEPATDPAEARRKE